MRRHLGGFWLVCLLCCGQEQPDAEGHLLLHVSTDAPLPAAPGDPPAPGALFDRLRIQVYGVGHTEPCSGCSREVAADRGALAPASFALLGSGRSATVRLQLYRSGGTLSGEPRPRSTIERVVRVPPVPNSASQSRHVVLATEAVGAPSGTLDAPGKTLPGSLGSSPVGSWAPAARQGCAETPGADEACIVGGAQWLGNPRLDLTGYPEIDGSLERLAQVPPFLLDRSEVTVEQFRASGLSISLYPGALSDNPREKGTGIVGCTYTTDSSETDGLPVNCISWSLAQKYCESLGRRLPTEAEFERAASALGESAFVWGEDLPHCEDAVFARLPSEPCGTLGTGPLPPGSGARDRLETATGTVVDLAGNLSEWSLDLWNREDEACWQPPLLMAPVCETPSAQDGPARPFRGGHFDSVGPLLQASARSWVANEEFAVDRHIGFRCARSATPVALEP